MPLRLGAQKKVSFRVHFHEIRLPVRQMPPLRKRLERGVRRFEQNRLTFVRCPLETAYYRARLIRKRLHLWKALWGRFEHDEKWGVCCSFFPSCTRFESQQLGN